jgi:C4-dicarboxylate-specific signal transduction histidine kinase
MIKRFLSVVNKYSLADPLIRVNKLFFISNKKSELIRLQNNFVFRHACMTPLTILSCTLDNLNNNNLDNITKKTNILSAKEAISHLNRIIAAVTKNEDKSQVFQVNSAINEAILLFKSKTNCNIYYSNYLSKKIKIFGNKLYFQEIIICLLNNAYEAYADKKTIHISLSVRMINKQIFIGVADFAKGMTPLGLKLALLKGVSYKEDGLGLGLSFVKETIENEFGGILKIMSGYGVGTHVQVSIPIPEPYSQNLLQS